MHRAVKYVIGLATLAAPLVINAPASASNVYCSSIATVVGSTLNQNQQSWTLFQGSYPVTGALYNMYYSTADMVSLSLQYPAGGQMWVGHENVASAIEGSGGWHILTFEC